MMFRVRVLAMLVWLCSSSFVKSDELKELVISNWKSLVKECRVTSFAKEVKENGKLIRSVTFAFQHDYEKYEKSGSVILSNGDWTYVLKKNVKGDWAIENLSESKERSEIESHRNLAITLGDVDLLKATYDENFEFSDWKKVDGKISFQVQDLEEMKLRSSNEKHKPAAFGLVTVIVDPENYCRIVSTKEERQVYGVRSTLTHDYTYTADRVVPSVINRENRVSTGKVLTLERIFSRISHEPLPEKEFSLEHYGLKELHPKSNGWLNGLVFLAVPLAALVVFLSWKYVRRG